MYEIFLSGKIGIVFLFGSFVVTTGRRSLASMGSRYGRESEPVALKVQISVLVGSVFLFQRIGDVWIIRLLTLCSISIFAFVELSLRSIY
jgi:hypothetical protein